MCKFNPYQEFSDVVDMQKIMKNCRKKEREREIKREKLKAFAYEG
jgi:hypothetical protein